jgi:hypothetical protein
LSRRFDLGRQNAFAAIGRGNATRGVLAACLATTECRCPYQNQHARTISGDPIHLFFTAQAWSEGSRSAGHKGNSCKTGHSAATAVHTNSVTTRHAPIQAAVHLRHRPYAVILPPSAGGIQGCARTFAGPPGRGRNHPRIAAAAASLHAHKHRLSSRGPELPPPNKGWIVSRAGRGVKWINGRS